MAGEKRFGTALFGFKRSDVNSYFEKMLRDFEDKLKEKEMEISALKNQNREIRLKYEELVQKANQVNEEKARIADVLVRAQEKEQSMLEEAKVKANEEKRKLNEMIEGERERYVIIKEQLRVLRTNAVEVLKDFEAQLDELVEGEELKKVENF